MKVIIDANVFLSYLLSPTTKRTITRVVTACFTHDEIEVLLPQELIEEISEKVTHKRYFRRRIPHTQIDQFITQLTTLAELLPPLEEIASYGRDPEDDYLIAYSIVNEIDYLITGDPDLLVLHQIEKVRILKPAAFLTTLRVQGFI